MKMLKSLAALAVLASPALAEIRTDDAGREVDLPPRIETAVGLHDAIITLPLYELGVKVLGSHGRPTGEEGKVEVFGLQELFGVTSEEAGIANIGGYDGVDLEVIRQLAPDVIVGSEGNAEQAEAMSGAAPFYVQRSFTGDVYGLSGLRAMAEAFGRMPEYEALEATYQARVAEVKAALPFDPAEKTYVGIILFDQMMVANGLSGMVQAMHDLGFQHPQWVQDLGQSGFLVPLSSEKLDIVESDLIILLPGYSDPDQSEANTRAMMDKIAPGWDRVLDAGADGNVIFTPSVPMVTPTFASATRALDVIEAFYTK